MPEVVVVGAGPTGLFLAGDLALQGVRVVVLEALPAPTGLSKALGVQARGVELLEARGLLPRFPEGPRPTGNSGFHFAGLPLAGSTRFLFIQQAQVEAALAQWVAELGVPVLRGHELRAHEDLGDAVRLTVRTPAGTQTMHARFLVGCDGGASGVRQRQGIAFPGTEPTVLLRLGDVRLEGATLTPAGVELPGGVLAPFRAAVPLGDGWFRTVSSEPWPPGFDRAAPMHLEELTASVQRTMGVELPVSGVRWLSRFTDASRLAETFRQGRVFLAGDAAHVHLPAGGPGISTGLNDAANLSWRLTRVLRGHGDEGVLDGYSEERRQAVARVMLSTRAQAALMAHNPNTPALRQLMGELLTLPQVQAHLGALVQGADQHYAPGEHPWVGKWMPEKVALHEARAVLIDRSVDGAVGRRLAQPWLEVRPQPGHGGVSFLVRPDGYVAWAGTA